MRNNRYAALKDILDRKKYFKVVCGAGNEDPEEIRRLAVVYTLAGTTAIDISANVDVVKAAARGIEQAQKLASKLKRKINSKPFINVSVGLAGDPHIRKARINQEKCSSCGECLKVCQQQAIDKTFRVLSQKCIGCGNCVEICSSEAIEFYEKKMELDKILPQCLAKGTETLEIHAVTEDDESVKGDWRLINTILPDNFISMCLDRSLLSDKQLINRIREAYRVTGERMIVQADGAPMSGGDDNFNTTLQAVAIADIVKKSKLAVYLLLSGGTNSQTGRLSRQCGVDFNGVSVGTFARKIVREFISRDDFDTNIDTLNRAVQRAEELIKINITN